MPKEVAEEKRKISGTIFFIPCFVLTSCRNFFFVMLLVPSGGMNDSNVIFYKDL